MNTNAPPKRRRKIRRRVIKTALVLILAIGILFASGWPQRKLVEFALERALGVEVGVARVRMLGTLRIDLLVISDPGQEPGNPVLIASDVVVNYSLFPGDGRHISNLSIQDLIVHLDLANPENTNFDFLLKEPEKESTTKDAFLPKFLNVANVYIAVSHSEGQSSYSGLALTGTIHNALDQTFTLRSNSLPIPSLIGRPYPGPVMLSDSPINVQARLIDNRIEIDVNELDLPGLITVAPGARFSMTMALGDGDASPLRQIDLTVPSARIEGKTLAAHFGEFLPLPISFDAMTFTELAVHASREDGSFTFEGSRFDIAISGLVVGEADHALFDSDLIIRGKGHETGGEVSLFIDDLNPMRIESTRQNGSTTLHASFAQWPHEAIIQLVPSDLREHIAQLQFDEIEGDLTLRLEDSTYTLEGEFNSTGSSPAAHEAIRVTMSANGSTVDAPALAGEFSAQLGDGSIDATVYVQNKDTFSVSVQLAQVEARPWMALVSQADPLKDVEGFLNGVVTAETTEAQEKVSITAALTMNAFAYKGVSYDQIDVAGVLHATKSFDQLYVEKLHAEADDFTTYLTLTDWEVALAPFDAKGQFESTFDLEVVATLAKLPDLRGEGTVSGPIHIDEQTIEATLSLRLDYIGYGEIEMPYGTPLLASMEIALDRVESRGTLRALSLTLGEGTRVDSETITFALDPPEMRGRIDTTSDLLILVDMGILESAEGTFTAYEDITHADGITKSEWELKLAVENLVLAGGVAMMSDVSLTGTGVYDGGLSGTGYMAVGEMSAAGAHIRSFGGQAFFEGDTVRFPDTDAKLLGGSLVASIELGLLRDGLPLQLSATFDAIDLAQLTEEVQPPRIKLTGVADGSGTFGYSLSGLSNFSLTMQSNKGFSLNRAVVAELLQTDRFRQAIGAARMEQTLGKFLGSAPQRPFDSATLELHLAPNTTDAETLLIEGQATLNSVKTKAYNGLNMSVNLAVDTATLAQTLKTLEEGAVEGVEF